MLNIYAISWIEDLPTILATKQVHDQTNDKLKIKKSFCTILRKFFCAIFSVQLTKNILNGISNGTFVLLQSISVKQQGLNHSKKYYNKLLVMVWESSIILKVNLFLLFSTKE